MRDYNRFLSGLKKCRSCRHYFRCFSNSLERGKDLDYERARECRAHEKVKPEDIWRILCEEVWREVFGLKKRKRKGR
jgi:uncharacterized protein (UPF0179 family)